MEGFEAFEKALAEFGEKMNYPLALEDGELTFTVDGSVNVNIRCLEDSRYLVLWASVGELPDDELAGERAAALLEMNDLGLGTRGFTLGMRDGERRLVIHDRRPVSDLESADAIAAWTGDLVETTEMIRERLAADFPAD